MSFERFKKEIKNRTLDELNQAIQERKKLLIQWNNPIERKVILKDDEMKAYCKHPFKKTRREIAILNNLVHQKLRGPDGRI